MRMVRYASQNNRSSGSGFAAVSPWTGLESEIDRLFNTALTNFGSSRFGHQFPVGVYEDANNTYVRAELPGVNRDEINVEMVDGILNISAARKQKTGDVEESFSFSRSINLPEGIHTDRVAATYENGILAITLPKREEAKPKKISVAVN
jgi:HSP20 family protein